MDIKEQIARVFDNYEPLHVDESWEEHTAYYREEMFQRALDILNIPDVKEALSLLELNRQGKLVKLADKQDLPVNPCHDLGEKFAYQTAQENMIAAGFKRVEPL